MTETSNRESRWRLVRDVVVFQIKLGMEAVLDLTLIPASLAAAGLDLVLGNWRHHDGSTPCFGSASAANTGSTCGASRRPAWRHRSPRSMQSSAA